MADNKRYYWLKLIDDFFDSKRIKKLRRMAGGDTYTIIYLKMQLLSLKSDGILEYMGLEDEFYKELALDLDEDEINVQATVMFLLSCGLLETSDNLTYSLPFAKKNLGSETAVAQRVREHRARQKVLHCNTDETPVKQNVTKMQQNGDIDTNNNKSNINNNTILITTSLNNKKEKKDITNVISKKEKVSRHKFGEYKHVLLTDAQHQKLLDDFGEDNFNAMIVILDEYLEVSGKSYKNHNLVLRGWVRKELEKRETQSQDKPPKDLSQYSAEELWEMKMKGEI